MSNRIFALVDCNNFFVSCELVFTPKLIGKPVVVLSNNDGCIISRSNEAKALGIKMGEPFYRVKDLLQKNNVAVFSPNFILYGDLSHRIMVTLAMFASELEVYSIDEAFMNLTGIEDPDRHARHIRKTILQWVKIPVSIGIASTKTLSKVANHLAKHHPPMGGVLDLTDTKLIEGALKLTPVEEVWGVGRRLTKKLQAQGIKTAYDLTQVDDKWIMKHFSVMFMRTVYELRGTPCFPLELCPPPKKNIMTSRSFGRQTGDLKELKQAISTYTARGAEKLRADGLATKTVMVFLRTNKFRPWEEQYANHAMMTLPVATDCTHELIHYAQKALESIHQKGYSYHKCCVLFMDLVPKHEIQGGLFDQKDRERLSSLMVCLDSLSKRHGIGVVRYAAEGLEKRWRMRQEHRSKRYTTVWEELLSIG